MCAFMYQTTPAWLSLLLTTVRGVFILYRLSLWLRIIVVNSYLARFKSFFDKNKLLYTSHLLLKILYCFHITTSNNWWQNSVQSWGKQFDLPPFWIASKQIFFLGWNNFRYKPLPNNPEFIFIEKNPGCFFFQRLLKFIEWNLQCILSFHVLFWFKFQNWSYITTKNIENNQSHKTKISLE